MNAEDVANNLRLKEFEVLLLHGDMDQIERNNVIMQFKRKELSILVATDVAGIFFKLMLSRHDQNATKVDLANF